MTVINISPTPIYYIPNTEYNISEEELNVINSIPMITNKFCELSESVHVLDLEGLSGIKKLCQYHVDQFTKEVCKIRQDFYIQTSWVTKKYKSQFHQLHTHPNSIMSGIFYIDVTRDMGPLTFKNENFLTKKFDFAYDYEEWNAINSSTYSLNVTSNSIVIFPSWLNHSVEENQSDTPRISIAFNVFVKDYFENCDGWQSDYGTALI